MTGGIHESLFASATLFIDGGAAFTYHCETGNDRIVVTDARGRIVFAFGSHGTGLGQFDTPVHLAFVSPEFHGESLGGASTDTTWLAVADYGNCRIQLFDLDGSPIGAIPDQEDAHLGRPCFLTWQAPVLHVVGEDGTRTAVHLAAALLYVSDGPARKTRERRLSPLALGLH
jgi:hypothetical protein